MTMQLAQKYALEQANNLIKITLTDFFKNIHERFYPDQDIFFMDYFLYLTEHAKLIEFGVMTSKESSDVKKKLIGLDLAENNDFRVSVDIYGNSKSTGRPSKSYTLTSKAFKKCLMRAQRRDNQPIDPVIYWLITIFPLKAFTSFIQTIRRLTLIGCMRLKTLKIEIVMYGLSKIDFFGINYLLR